MYKPTEREITSIMLSATGTDLVLGMFIMPNASQGIQIFCLGACALISAVAVYLVFRPHPEISAPGTAAELPPRSEQYVYTPIDLPPLAGSKTADYDLWH